MSVFDETKEGFGEAIEFEKCNINTKTAKLTNGDENNYEKYC